MSGFLILAAAIVPATSGRLVPIAIIVEPITKMKRQIFLLA